MEILIILNVNQIEQVIYNAQQFRMQGRLHDAKNLLISTLNNNPTNSNLLLLLAQTYLQMSEFKKAEPLLEQCISLIKESPTPLLLLSQLKMETKDYSQSTIFFYQLIKQFPNYANGYFCFSGLQQAMGKLDEAKSLLEKVIYLEPRHCQAYLALTQLIDDDKQENLTAIMEKLLFKSEPSASDNDAALNKQDLMLLYFALGRSLDVQNKYSEAINYWHKANKIQLTQCGFRVSQMEPFYKALKQQFTDSSSLLSYSKKTEKCSSLTPIFIVGMPRSGSTLLEQMLSNHSEIETAGELNILSDIVVRKLEGFTGKHYPLGLDSLNDKHKNELAQCYLGQLQTYHPTAKFIIDKLPANFQSIGLIKMLMPDAIIIHLTREPLAVALSIYSNYFAENEPYFCNLNELAQYYNLYHSLMVFWQSVDAGSYLQICYEDLVRTPQNTLEKILDVTGLAWQQKCLDNRGKENHISTLSDIQVRKPLYDSSINKWQKYQALLSDFSSKLDF